MVVRQVLRHTPPHLHSEMGQGQHAPATAAARNRPYELEAPLLALSQVSQGLQQQGGAIPVPLLLQTEGGPTIRPLAGAPLLWPDMLQRAAATLQPSMPPSLPPWPVSTLSQDGTQRLPLWSCPTHGTPLQFPALVMWWPLWEDADLWLAPVFANVSSRRLQCLSSKEPSKMPVWSLHNR